MPIFERYKDSIEKFITFLKKDLVSLNITSAIVYGSSTYPNQFTEGLSDIDVCAFTDEMDNMPPELIKGIIADTGYQFKDKQPKFFDDAIARRIEFYLEYPDITFDVTLLPNNIRKILRYDELPKTSCYDSLEMLIGALHIYSKPLFGESPFLLKGLDREFIPFYGDTLRKERLDVLTKRVRGYLSRVEKMSTEYNPDIADSLFKCRNYFVKWLFIYKRKYPVNLSKHLHWQFGNILELDKTEINTLMFTASKSIYDSAEKFIKISRRYLDEYLAEKRFIKNANDIKEIITIAPIKSIFVKTEENTEIINKEDCSGERLSFNQLSMEYAGRADRKGVKIANDKGNADIRCQDMKK